MGTMDADGGGARIDIVRLRAITSLPLSAVLDIVKDSEFLEELIELASRGGTTRTTS